MNLPPDLIEVMLRRSASKILSSTDYESADKSALFELSRLTHNYLTFLVHRLQAFTKTNRRQGVSTDDLELTLFMENISLHDLEQELVRLHGEQEDLATSETKVARGFESIDRRVQTQLLGPELNGRSRGIPGYMEKGMILPALPPLYTHYKTPVYVDRIRDVKEIKVQATNATRGIDESLRKLIELSEKVESSDEEIDEGINDLMKTSSRQQQTKRKEMFKRCWQEMGYGEPVHGKAIHWRPS